jgi:hypothetical protein
MKGKGGNFGRKYLFLSAKDLMRLGQGHEKDVFGLSFLPSRISVSWLLWGFGICVDLTKDEEDCFLHDDLRIIQSVAQTFCFCGFEGTPVIGTGDSRNFYNPFINDGSSSMVILNQYYAKRGAGNPTFRLHNYERTKL